MCVWRWCKEGGGGIGGGDIGEVVRGGWKWCRERWCMGRWCREGGTRRVEVV